MVKESICVGYDLPKDNLLAQATKADFCQILKTPVLLVGKVKSVWEGWCQFDKLCKDAVKPHGTSDNVDPVWKLAHVIDCVMHMYLYNVKKSVADLDLVVSSLA